MVRGRRRLLLGHRSVYTTYSTLTNELKLPLAKIATPLRTTRLATPSKHLSRNDKWLHSKRYYRKNMRVFVLSAYVHVLGRSRT